MWISSSPSKNRSDRGRIYVFFRGLNWIVKASLLILALASFSVASADSIFPEWCPDNRKTCFAKTSDELESGWGDYIRIENGGILWNASKKSPDESKIGLYKEKDKECKKLSFNMTTPESDKECKFSMLYNDCVMDIEWTKDVLKFMTVNGGFNGKDGGTARVIPGSSVNVELEGGELKCNSEKCNQKGVFCKFTTREDGDWCEFKFAFTKIGSCDGTMRFGQDYKLLATTQAPTTAAPEETTTTQGTAESGLSPWIIVGIVLVVLLLVAGGAGLLVFLICRRKRREPAQNMAEKGNAGIDCLCETAVSSSVVLQTAVSGEKPVSAKVNEPPKNERKDERSKPTSQTEVAKPVPQKKQNVPEQRAKTAVEMNEPKRDPKKAAPMPPSKKKSDKKKDEAKNVPAPSSSSKKMSDKKKDEAKKYVFPPLTSKLLVRNKYAPVKKDDPDRQHTSDLSAITESSE